jgi:methyltransferase (TIGR00027 family)
MQHGGASRTALGAAAHRAVHQIVDRPRIFEDELAVPILGDDGAELLKQRLAEPSRFSGLRALIAVRSRIAGDALEAGIARGVRQYVVLGAGLDTSAYRRPTLADGLQIFEVDHAATQEWKRGRLAAVGIAACRSPIYVPVDFERAELGAALDAAGFRFDAPAIFAWLGVLPYLERPAIRATSTLIGGAPGKMEIILDYAEPPSTLSEARRAAFDRVSQRVAAIGEPWRSFFTQAEMETELQGAGFVGIEDLDAAALTARYCSHRDDGLVVSPPARVLRAWN